MYTCVCVCVCVCMYLHQRCSELRVARKRITTIKQVFCQQLQSWLLLLLHASTENHSHFEVDMNVEDLKSVLYRLSITNCKMFVHVSVICKYMVLLTLYKFITVSLCRRAIASCNIGREYEQC